MFDPKFVRKVARGTAAAVTRFDPTLCGKALRIAAAVSLIEFLLTVAIMMMGLSTDWKCSSWQTPIGDYMLVFLSGAVTLYLCILAVLWTPIARKMAALDERRGRSIWVSFFFPTLPPTALLIAIFCSLTAAVALPLIAIIQERLPLDRCFFRL